jgi:hypothetical protein
MNIATLLSFIWIVCIGLAFLISNVIAVIVIASCLFYFIVMKTISKINNTIT